jgi:uncharacterized protein (DUF302 family)
MKNLIYLLAGLLSGIVITLLFITITGQSMMFEEKVSLYGFEETAALLEKSAKEHQWRIPAVHDMQKTMKSIEKTVPNERIFELCKPEYAYEVVRNDEERIASTMLPCRVAIYEKSDGKTYVSLMNMNLMGQLMNGTLPGMMKKASGEIDEIIAPLFK